MTRKQIIKFLNTRKKNIGIERDKLREVISELEALEEDCETAMQDLESCVDTLSRLT